MTAIIRSIKNVSGVTLTLQVPGYDPTNPVTIANNATLDLLTIITSEALHAMQLQLSGLVSDGSITVTGYIDSSDIEPGAMMNWVSSHNSQIVFTNTTQTGAHGATGVTSPLSIQDASNVINPFDNTDTVIVTGTYTGTPASVVLTGGSPLAANSTVVTFVSGQASVGVTSNLAHSVATLSLSSGPGGITETSTDVISFTS